MNQSIVPREIPQLNPFVFPSETDSRFLLLVIAVAGITLVLVNALIGGVIGLSVLPSFLIAVTVTVFIFIWAWQQARQDANKKIKMLNLESFPPKSYNPDEDAFLKRLADYVETIAITIPDIEKSHQNLFGIVRIIVLGVWHLGLVSKNLCCLDKGFMLLSFNYRNQTHLMPSYSMN